MLNYFMLTVPHDAIYFSYIYTQLNGNDDDENEMQ